MIVQKKTINNIPTLVPLTADTGSGNPIGTIIAVYTNQVPAGYLFCDGSAFDETAYPALYALLGDNHTPDLREVTLKGIGNSSQSTTHLENGGLSIGEFLDDRVKTHYHLLSGSDYPFVNGAYSGVSGWKITSDGSISNGGATLYMETQSAGAVTNEVKSVGVKWCIKATTGLDENQQDYVLNAINENNSYSTEEHATGKKWIDGKTIYRKVIAFGVLPSSGLKEVAHNISNFDTVTSLSGTAIDTTRTVFPLPRVTGDNNFINLFMTSTNVCINVAVDRSNCIGYVTVEYTKTV